MGSFTIGGMSNSNKILVIGVGSIGERHLRCFQTTGRCELAFCEPVASRREQVAERYDVQGYDSWETAVDQENFDAAVIACPAPWHIPIAQDLCDRGLDLLIEKPLSLSLQGIGRLENTVRSRGTRVAIGFTYRSIPAFQNMRAALHENRFGRLVQLQVTSGQHFPFYRPAYREIYYADPKLGGGLIQDMLPHHLNAVEWLAGPTSRVVCDAAHQVLKGVDVEDTVNVLARHENVMTSITLNQHQPVNEFVITAICEHGSARWELTQQRWLSAREPGGEWTQEEAFVHDRDDYYILQANAFLDFRDGSAEPLCDLQDGIQTLKTMLAVQQSLHRGGWVTVDTLCEDL